MVRDATTGGFYAVREREEADNVVAAAAAALSLSCPIVSGARREEDKHREIESVATNNK